MKISVLILHLLYLHYWIKFWLKTILNFCHCKTNNQIKHKTERFYAYIYKRYNYVDTSFLSIIFIWYKLCQIRDEDETEIFHMVHTKRFNLTFSH